MHSALSKDDVGQLSSGSKNGRFVNAIHRDSRTRHFVSSLVVKEMGDNKLHVIPFKNRTMSSAKPLRTLLLIRILLSIATVNAWSGLAIRSCTGTARPTAAARTRCIGGWIGPQRGFVGADPTRTRTLTGMFLASSAVEVLTLEKPLGLVLEEVVENEPRGVYVREVSDSGSARPHRSTIVGLAVRSVQGRDVARLRFDQVMDVIARAPSPLSMEFAPLQKEADDQDKTDDDAGGPLPVGTPVTLTVLLDGNGKQSLAVEAKVGDNLRKTLLDSGVEVYTGFQNIGNCGGAGQCGLCAFDLLLLDGSGSGSDGWLERSEYEDKKLRRFPQARLTCLNSIQGPATIRKTKQ
jgi:ferredoxin